MNHAHALRIRLAVHDDLAQLVEFNARMARETEGRELDRARLSGGIARVLADPTCGVYRIALADERAVGCLLVTREWSDWRNGWFWWIQSVFVDASARRRGVYRALHENVLSAARADPEVCGVRLYVDRENTSAQAVYRRVGLVHAHYELFETDFVLAR